MTPLSSFARFAWGVLAYNVAVVLWGALVRATGSGAGCGRHWPACNGQVMPQLASTHTMIEFAHRATSGIALLLVLAMLVWAWRAFPRGHLVRRGAALSTAFIIAEALLGAGLVLFELVADDKSAMRAFSMSAHLVNTFLLLGALTLTGWWASGGAPVRVRKQGALGAVLLTAVGATILVGATGAVTALGDTLFPKSAVGFDLSSTAHFLERLRIVHPLLAVVTSVYITAVGWMVRRARPSATTRRLAAILTALFAVQVAAGLVNIVLRVPIWMQLTHLFLADCVWIALVLTTASALAHEPAEARPAGSASCTPPPPRVQVR
ncbi:MAG: Heme A synthase, cytochrome oxidase biogenesis protein Cox15-CtaA [uncultured Gemmatimonadetes bacterium]|uniref:Heme A synthase, cytochrome oxidase biogenesis protein Cox15-CtaA n=1 Tax=uncultured Gemmatimonadota bacterium TaxID=203437 RepID=A0A6J4KF85_9BACT|nr:MAG: Heme A synthase, cytochrome oxidase biogenesis protein Cox15-CtaA [uncultured Gemmatimonadota bacterium]